MSFTEIIIVVETTTSVEWMMVLFVFVFVFGKFGLSDAIVGGSLVLGATRHLVPNRSGSGSFAYSSFEDYYWTSNGNTSNTAYTTVKGDGRHSELTSNSGSYISMGLTRNVRFVRDTSNVCEIDPL